MKLGKVGGYSGLLIVLTKLFNELGNEMVFSFVKPIWEEKIIPTEWENSKTVPIYNQKGISLDCVNYQGIKLPWYLLNVTEQILEQRLR